MTTPTPRGIAHVWPDSLRRRFWRPGCGLLPPAGVEGEPRPAAPEPEEPVEVPDLAGDLDRRTDR